MKNIDKIKKWVMEDITIKFKQKQDELLTYEIIKNMIDRVIELTAEKTAREIINYITDMIEVYDSELAGKQEYLKGSVVDEYTLQSLNNEIRCLRVRLSTIVELRDLLKRKWLK